MCGGLEVHFDLIRWFVNWLKDCLESRCPVLWHSYMDYQIIKCWVFFLLYQDIDFIPLTKIIFDKKSIVCVYSFSLINLTKLKSLKSLKLISNFKNIQQQWLWFIAISFFAARKKKSMICIFLCQLKINIFFFSFWTSKQTCSALVT